MLGERSALGKGEVRWQQHTRDHVAGIRGVFVLDEAEAIHQFDLHDFAGAMGGEVGFNVGLCSYAKQVQLASPKGLCGGNHRDSNSARAAVVQNKAGGINGRSLSIHPS
jgi:hypothetical protein